MTIRETATATLVREEQKARAFLRELDDARYGWMMRQWVRLAEKPKVVLGLFLVSNAAFYLLGKLV